MKLGVVVGQVIATRKDEKLVGSKLLVIRPINEKKRASGDTLVAVDTVGAGVGETVLYVGGSVSPRAMRDTTVPADAAIVGIVDQIDCYEGK